MNNPHRPLRGQHLEEKVILCYVTDGTPATVMAVGQTLEAEALTGSYGLQEN